jgi:hypothetical protein
MKKVKEKQKQELDAEEIEKIFETTWKNWESRRRCEQAHPPKYIKKKRNDSRN